MDGVDISQSQSLQYSSVISENFNNILKKINIEHFWFIRIFHKDNSRIILTNYPQWVEHFYYEGFYKNLHIMDAEFLQGTGYYTWENLKTGRPFDDGVKYFMLHDGVTMLKKDNDYTDLYCFATSKEKLLDIDIIRKGRDLLDRFIFYFKEKSYNLIDEISDSRIFLDNLYYKNTRYLNLKTGSSNKEIIESFIRETTINKIFVTGSKYLTNQEALCIKHLINGKTAKEIAEILNISYRTVESHISNVKKKFDFRKMQEASYMLTELNFKSLFESDLLKSFDLEKIS